MIKKYEQEALEILLSGGNDFGLYDGDILLDEGVLADLSLWAKR